MLATSSQSPKYHFTLLVLALFSMWWQCCSGSVRNSNHLNPNMECPGRNVQQIWRPCEHGGYIAENPNAKVCGDRYVCYKGVNERCTRQDKCADNAICTMCGICQKCDNPHNCSEFELCPQYLWSSNNELF